MKTTRLILFTATLIALGLGISTVAPTATAYAGCGIKPIKPITPIGCDDLDAQCTCDAKGQNCEWKWVCVKRKK